MGDPTRRLEGKVAVVTGGGRGIGRALAIAYAREGASVCVAARTSGEVEQTAGEIEGQGGKGLAVQADVTLPDSVGRVFDATVDHFGGLDILVVNAGGNYDRRRVEESDADGWRTTVELNLIGAYHCAKAAIPHLKRRGAGKIIMVGSGQGHRGLPATSAYSCSKAALWMLTRVLAEELWEYNISVNELIPGPVLTGATRSLADRPAGTVFGVESEWIKMPEDVTELALFMATQPDKGPTGQSFSLLRRVS